MALHIALCVEHMPTLPELAHWIVRFEGSVADSAPLDSIVLLCPVLVKEICGVVSVADHLLHLLGRKSTLLC